MANEIDKLRKFIEESNRIVFFGGAGVSTESGIPDFRSSDGLYNTKYKYPPETIVSKEFFESNPAEFYRFYKEKMLFPDAQPNFAHQYLAELEKEGKLKEVITQNIDGLHQKAGSENVLELHGSALRNHCTTCGKFYGMDSILQADGIPHCPKCGGIIKPDVTLYGEDLPDGVIDEAIKYVSEADMLIIGGTSLSVYPAAFLVNYYKGSRLVLINMSSTKADSYADLVIHGKIGEVFKRVKAK